MKDILDTARKVFETEGNAVLQLGNKLTEDFPAAVEAIMNCSGRVVVSGMGKSGIIARKIVATFSSTGTPSIFLHPSEAIHGDLGMITSQDVFVALSKSGETDELLRLIPYIRAQGVPLICLVGKPASTLARRGACPLQLAPTASTTATLAMGDALAMTLMELRNFQPEHFAHLHPGGSLGRRLITTVRQLMRTQELPVLSPDDSIKQVIHSISAGRLGLVVIRQEGNILGIITDGDVRRAMERMEEQFFSLNASDLLIPNPVCISPETKAVEAEALMRQKKITSLLVTQEGKLQGVIQIYDLGL